jgi:hypothetical protein
MTQKHLIYLVSRCVQNLLILKVNNVIFKFGGPFFKIKKLYEQKYKVPYVGCCVKNTIQLVV